MEVPATEHRPFRRSLRWALAVTILVVLAAFGYRKGYRRGHEPQHLVQLTANSLVMRTYPVADLIVPRAGSHPSKSLPDFDPLIDLIVSTVETETWMENGTGEGEIQPFPTQETLVVSQTQRVHEQISDVLDQLRRLPMEVAAKEAIPMLQTRAACRQDGSYAIRSFSNSKPGDGVAAKCLAQTTLNIADIWGSPAFRGQRDDADFPAWSTAEELACWPRGAGVAYIAIESDANDRPQLILGWRPNDGPDAPSADDDSP